MIDRRSFIGLGALALCATGSKALAVAPCCAAKKCKKVPFKLGVAGYTYNKFSIDETLAFLERLDVHYLCIKNFHLPFDSTPAQIAEFKKKCADHGVTGYGVGPIYMSSNEEAKKAFDYAAAIGVKTVVAQCPVPIVIAGGKKLPEEKALELAYKAIQAGAAGVDMGRNVFQSAKPLAMMKAISAVVHQGLSAQDAFQLYNDEK